MSKSKNEPIYRFLSYIAVLPLCLLCSCGCYLFMILFAQDVWGTFVESTARYPNSEMIWVGYDSYGDEQYGSKIYIRWTPDDANIVRIHYEPMPRFWKAEVIAVEDIDFSELSVCWRVGFQNTGGCQVVKETTPNYGTLIVFSYDYWIGFITTHSFRGTSP